MRLSVSPLVVLFGLVIAPSVSAQQSVARDSGRVRTDSGKAGIPFALPPIVVTATVEPVSQDRIGITSAIIGEQELHQTPTPSAAQVLRRLPDIFVDESAGPGGPTVLRIRGGEEPYTKVLFDGVPININGGFMDIQGLTMSNLERVEVTRGPQSALYGSSAVSGVVQFITRRGTVGRPIFEFTSEGGAARQNGETGRGELSVRGGTSRLLYSAGGSLGYNRGIYAIAQNEWTKDGSLRLDALASSKLGFTAIARYARIRTNLPVRDAGVTRVPLDPNQKDSRNRLVASFGADFHPSASSTQRLTLGVLRDNFYYGDVTDGITQSPDFFVSDFSLKDRNNTRRATLEYTGTNRTHGFTLSYGGLIEKESNFDSLTGDFGNSSIDLGRNSKALFTDAQAALGTRVNLLAGTRWEKFQGITPQFTPRASVVIDLVPKALLLRGSVGRTFKTPNLQQQFLDNPFTVPNPHLAPETSLSWEFGPTVVAAAARVRAGLTYFHQEYRNLIRTVPATDDPRQTNVNLGRSSAEGVELEISWQPSTHLVLGANGSWLKTRIIDNAGLPADQYPLGDELPFRPHVLGASHVEVMGGRWSLLTRVTVTGTQTVLTERFSGQRVPIGSYALADVMATFDASRNVGMYLSASNLFDTKYQTGFDKPGLPLRLVAGVRVTSR